MREERKHQGILLQLEPPVSAEGSGRTHGLVTLIAHAFVEAHLLAVDTHMVILLLLRQQTICLDTCTNVRLGRRDCQLLAIFEFVGLDRDISIQRISKLSILMNLMVQRILQLYGYILTCVHHISSNLMFSFVWDEF